METATNPALIECSFSYAEDQPRYSGYANSHHRPSQQQIEQREIEYRPHELILSQSPAPLSHPVPAGVRDERRKHDCADPLGHDIAEEGIECRHRQHEDKQLPELHADVE